VQRLLLFQRIFLHDLRGCLHVFLCLNGKGTLQLFERLLLEETFVFHLALDIDNFCVVPFPRLSILVVVFHLH